MQRGLMILKAGIHGQCLRVLVALVATDEQIDETLDVLRRDADGMLGAAASPVGRRRRSLSRSPALQILPAPADITFRLSGCARKGFVNARLRRSML